MTGFGEFTFARPEVFWILLVFPFLIALFFVAERRRKAGLDAFLAPRLQPRLAGSVSRNKRRWGFLLILTGLLLSILALAQPRWGFTWEERTSKGRDLIIAIDTSRSMLAQDLKPSRMARARFAAQDLLELLDGDRVGLVAFAGTAFLQAPLTADYDAVRNSLAEIDTEIIPRGGTNLTAAIEAAEDAFGKGESEHRALIIFTDGEELEADAVEAAKAAADKFRIFTVGMGSSEGGLIPFANERGGTDFVRDENGQYVTSRLDESRLREIADASGGFYVQLQSGPAEMQQIVREGLGKMKESESESRFSKLPIERYQWPLAGAVVCFVVSLLLGDRRRTATKATVLAVLALFCSTSSVHAVAEVAYNRGCEAFQRGDYKGAAQAFSEALGTGEQPLQSKAAFNLANTLARRGAALEAKPEKISEWKNALQHYDRVLELEPQHADAKYNRDLVKQAIADLEKEEKQQQQQSSEDQKKDEKKDEQNKDQQNSSGQGKEDQQQQQQQGKQDQQPQGKQDQQQKQDGKGEQDQQQQPSNGGEEKKDDPQSKQGQDQRGQPEQKDPKDGQQDPQKAQDGKSGEQKQQDAKPGEKKDSPQPPPDEKPKSGELKGANPQEQNDSKDPQNEAAEEAAAVAEGRMTPRDAKLMLEAMKKFDERVRLLDPREARRDRPARGFKNW